MKLIHWIMKLFVVLSLFALGVSVADKEYLSEHIIGLKLIGCDDPAIMEAVCAMVSADCSADLDELCASVEKQFLLQVKTDRCYFETIVIGDSIIPAGVYETICIEVDSDTESQISLLIPAKNIGRRFKVSQRSPHVEFQKGYVWFLSLLGKGEIILKNLTGVL